jgi:tetratricopeptide (TPR) repeat protein
MKLSAHTVRGPQDPLRLRRLSPTQREEVEFRLSFHESILADRPDQIDALRIAAQLYTELGYYEAGLNADRRIVQREPEDPLARYNLACSLALTRRPDEAFRELDEARSLGYRDREHALHDPDLASLRDDPRFLALMDG